MPRMNLTEDEASYIEAVRRKNAAAIAHNAAVDLCIALLKEGAGSPITDVRFSPWLEQKIEALHHLKQPVRP